MKKRILGVDFGTKKVGIAVSDRDGNFALPKVVLQNDKDLMHNLEKIINEENIGEIVVGESLNYKGEENIPEEFFTVFKKIRSRLIDANKRFGKDKILPGEF